MSNSSVFSKKIGLDSVDVATAIGVATDNLKTLISGAKNVADKSTKRVDLDKGLVTLNGISSDIQSAASSLSTGIRCHT